MNKYFALALVSFVFGGISFAQKGLKKTELPSDLFLVDVNNNAEKLFSSKYKSACIAYNKKTKEFLLYGDANGTDIIFLEKIPNTPLRFNPDKFIVCNYKGGKVYLSSQITGKATIVTGVFNWVDEHLVWEKEETTDLSEMQIVRAKNLLKTNKVLEGILTYDSVQYAESYFDPKIVSVDILLASQKEINDYTTKKKYKESAALAEKVLLFNGMKWFVDLKTETALKTSIGKNYNGLTYASFQLYIEGYTKNLLEAKYWDKTIEKVNLYWKYFTSSAPLLLNIADAWYAKKDKIKASENYVKYSSQMKLLKKEKDIPYYVSQRIIK